jgi:dimethylamine monooxygenase subunit A
MRMILQQVLPSEQSGDVRLPGVAPCEAEDWLRVDDAYDAQMRYRSALIAGRPLDVLYEPEGARAASSEVLREALAILPQLGFDVEDRRVLCPDGREVDLDWQAPLRCLGHLVQEDICVLQKRGDEHVLAAAVLCFPANWRLAEKVEQPLTAIHVPVDEYDANIARRVHRLFDGVQVGRPLWRFNRLAYADADLHQPRKREVDEAMPFLRSERQCILRLPETGAVVFTIHTTVVRRDDTPAAE